MAQFILSAFADEADSTLAGQIDALKRNGIDYIEMRNVNGKNIIDHTDDEVSEIKAQLKDAGIALSAVGSPIGKISITDPFELHLEKFKRTLEIAQMLDTKRIRLFSFYIPKGESPLAYRAEVFARMQAMLDAAKGTGILLCHENEGGIYGELPAQCLDLHQSFPDLKAIFDPANYVCAKADILWGIKNIAPYVDYLHIKDATLDGSIVPSGKGDGYVIEVLETLKDKVTPTFLSVEPHLAVFAGYAALDSRELKNKYTYSSNNEAFDAAVAALKEVLTKINYKRGENNIWTR